MNDEKHIKGDIYPLTIISDRYSGAYSDAQYLAFNLYPHSIPSEIGSDDMSESIFWNDHDTHQKYKIGKGDTPNEAYNDLCSQLYG